MSAPQGPFVLILQVLVWSGRADRYYFINPYGRGLRRKTRYFHGTFGRIRNVKRAPDASLWLTTSNGGGTDKVLRVTFG